MQLESENSNPHSRKLGRNDAKSSSAGLLDACMIVGRVSLRDGSLLKLPVGFSTYPSLPSMHERSGLLCDPTTTYLFMFTFSCLLIYYTFNEI